MSFDDFFGMLIGETIENTILNTAIENSLQSYNEDLFKKNDDFVIDMASERMAEEEVLTERCYICLEECKPRCVIYRLPCGHFFHKSCLDQAIAHQHYHCPTCKSKIPIKTNNIHYS